MGPRLYQRQRSNFVPAMGNFSVAYNFNSASIAVEVLRSKAYLGYPLKEEPAWSRAVTLPIVYLGAMCGMLFFGRLGDELGRVRAMRITLLLAILGALVPAMAFGGPDAVYVVVCLGRFVLGVGLGGIYPLSAASSAESGLTSEGKGVRVANAFFWQSLGGVAPYVLSMLLLSLIRPAEPAEWVADLQFRLIFALGATPAGIVLLASLLEEESEQFTTVMSSRSASRGGVWTTFSQQPWDVRRTLIGTAGSWFLYDMACFATSVFIPIILEDICLTGSIDKSDNECRQALFSTSEESAIVSCMGIPGCLLGIAMLRCIGSKRLNVGGFFLLASIFAAVAVVWSMHPERKICLFILFCALNFLLNFGPNIGTYVLPALCFPIHIRSTFHGMSATGGKLGALVGTLVFDPISESPLGVVGVLWLQVLVCIFGMLLSEAFLDHDWNYLDQSDRIATESFLHCSVANDGSTATDSHLHA